MKKVSGFLHLWLGLITGIIVFIVSLTGCIFVFEEEVFAFTHQEMVYVPNVGENLKPLSELKATVDKTLGKNKVAGNVEISSDPQKAYVFSASKGGKKDKKGWTYFDQLKYWDEVYINQYTGEVLGQVNRKYEFFNLVRRLHQNLLLRYDIGSMIVGISCLIFILMLFTGLILWIPKTKAGWKQRFSIKWNAKWRRVNYDSHNVGGFYVLPLAIIIVATGLVWSFKWWELGIYKMLGTNGKPRFNLEQSPTPQSMQVNNPSELALRAVLDKGLNYEKISVSFPEEADKPIRVFARLNGSSGWKESNYYYYNSVTGDQYGQLLQEDKTLGEKWRNTNYDIHTGGIYGLPTKILSFIASAICATLPVTGFIIWYGRRKRTKKKSPFINASVKRQNSKMRVKVSKVKELA